MAFLRAASLLHSSTLAASFLPADRESSTGDGALRAPVLATEASAKQRGLHNAGRASLDPVALLQERSRWLQDEIAERRGNLRPYLEHDIAAIVLQHAESHQQGKPVPETARWAMARLWQLLDEDCPF